MGIAGHVVGPVLEQHVGNPLISGKRRLVQRRGAKIVAGIGIRTLGQQDRARGLALPPRG